MLRNLGLVIGAAAIIGVLGYTATAFSIVLKSDATMVLSFAASERLPLMSRIAADWRVRSWDGCPVTERSQSPLSTTLRGYGLDGFDNDRILATATHLIELGCDVDQRNMTGHTAMHEAILYNEPGVVSFLLEQGADPAITIEVPDGIAARYYSGMNSIEFTEELQRKSSAAEDRGPILNLLRQSRG